jgi:hypothetical protein
MFRDFSKLALLTTFICFNVRAQIGQASITGTIVDSSDATVVGATVTARHLTTNVTYQSVVNQSGSYTFPALPVGGYEVSVTADGFKRAVRSGIVLEVGDKPSINFRLEIGNVVDTVEVTGAAPLVDTSGSTIGKVVESARIESLPLNGRSVLSLALLTPEVQGHTTTTQPGFGDRGDEVTNFSIMGGHPWLNAYILDGVNNTQARQGFAAVIPQVDAIEEFKIQSGYMSAEYGFTSGGVINMVTKSGGNSLHGTLYEFIRNTDLNARNAFATSIAPLIYNQYGGAVGGPIIKNRTFFFANVEQWRLVQSYNVLDTVPTAAERGGDFSQYKTASGTLIPIYDPTSIHPNPSGSGYVSTPFGGNMIPPNKLDPVAQNILKTFWPLPNVTPNNIYTNTNNFNTNNSGHSNALEEVFRIDHRFSAQNSFSIRYTLWDPKNDNGCCGVANAGLYPSSIARYRIDDFLTRNASISDIHTFSPTILNEFRLGISDLDYPALAASYGQGWPQMLGLPSNVPSYTLPGITMSGFDNFPGSNAAYKELFSAYTPQLIDNVTFIRGNHTLKVGIDLRRNRFNQLMLNGGSGTFNFTSTLTGNLPSPAGTGSGLASFLTGAVATATAQTDQPVTFQNFSWSFFFQDDWKVTRRLTVNLGLRWDIQEPVTETHNRLSNFNPFANDPQGNVLGELQFAGINFGKAIVQPDYRAFAPRAGLAWDVFGNGKTAIRTGYGIYYPSNFNTRYFQTGTAANNNITTTYVAPGGTTQLPAFFLQNGLPSPPNQPLGAVVGPSAYEGQAVNYQEANGKDTYVQEWDFTMQQQLPGSFLIEAAYSGSKGTRLITTPFNLNSLNPQYYSLGSALLSQVPNPYYGLVSGAFNTPTITRQQSLLPYPYYGVINDVMPRDGSSSYESWFVTLERRLSRGFVLLASYTFGKLIDVNTIGISSAQALGEQQALSATWRLPMTDRNLERGLDPTDAAGRFTMSAVYELPVGKGKMWQPSNAVVGAIVGGWSVNALATVNEGLPLVVRGANNFLADRPNSTGVSAQLSNPTVAEWFNTSVFVNPPSWTIGNVGNVLPNVRGPGAFNIDFSAVKDTRIREGWHLQLRSEFFNVLNHVNLLEPNTTFVPGSNGLNSSSTFGVINAARDPRIIQFALKLVF